MISTQQMKAIHVGFELIANQLNELGHGMHVVLNTKRDKFLIKTFKAIIDLCQKAINYLESKETIHVAWDKERVKDGLFRPIMIAMYEIKSTTDKDFTTEKANEVWLKMNEHLLNYGYLEREVDFPTHDKQE
jgi:hypothetical protein